MHMTEDAAGSTKETTDSPQGPQHAAPQALQVGTSALPSVAIALAVTLGLAAGSWVLSIQLMSGMAMGVATEIGSFGFGPEYAAGCPSCSAIADGFDG